MKNVFKLTLALLVMTAHVDCTPSREAGKVRPAAVAGQFYEADADSLRAGVERYIGSAGIRPVGGVQALIVPHAGYVYSGATAGKAFARLAPGARYERVFLIGPSHRAAFDGVSVERGHSAYATPLGSVAVDTATCAALAGADSLFRYLPEAHEGEHCLEVELPFLQERLREVPPLVPVIIGTTDYAKLRRIAAALRPYFTPDNLFVVSSDFSHYPSYEDAVEADRATGDALLSASPDAFLEAIADKAMKKDTGARALRAIIEDFMLDIMYEIPKDDNIGRVTITKDYIEGTGGPMIEIRGAGYALPEHAASTGV